MERSITLEIVRPDQTRTVTIRWIEVGSASGGFVVGPHHAPVISTFAENGRVLYKTIQNLEVEMRDLSGLFFVESDHARLILDT